MEEWRWQQHAPCRGKLANKTLPELYQHCHGIAGTGEIDDDEDDKARFHSLMLKYLEDRGVNQQHGLEGGVRPAVPKQVMRVAMTLCWPPLLVLSGLAPETAVSQGMLRERFPDAAHQFAMFHCGGFHRPGEFTGEVVLGFREDDFAMTEALMQEFNHDKCTYVHKAVYACKEDYEVKWMKKSSAEPLVWAEKLYSKYIRATVQFRRQPELRIEMHEGARQIEAEAKTKAAELEKKETEFKHLQHQFKEVQTLNSQLSALSERDAEERQRQEKHHDEAIPGLFEELSGQLKSSSIAVRESQTQMELMEAEL